MPAFVFPNADVLRIVLANGVVTRAVTDRPARGGFDPRGRPWLEPSQPVHRDALTALARLGVQPLAATGPAAESFQTWAELLPLRRAAPFPGPVLFELPDQQLSRVLAQCRRSGASLGATLHDSGQAMLLCETPPGSLLLAADDNLLEAFTEQSPGVWVMRGWEHPLPAHLPHGDGSFLLLRPPRSVEVRGGEIPAIAWNEFCLPNRPTPTRPAPKRPAIRASVRFKLTPCANSSRELAWVFPGEAAERFREFCAGANERLLRQFEAASTTVGGIPRIVVRPVPGLRIPPFLPLAADGYYPDPRVPGLFIPTRRSLHPVVRVRELIAIFDLSPERLTWVEAGPRGDAIPLAIPVAAFQPVLSLLNYEPPGEVRLSAESSAPTPFALERFAVIQSDEERLPPPMPRMESRPRAGRVSNGPPVREEERTGWFTRSLERLLRTFRRPAPEPVEEPPPARPAREPAPGRMEKKLASPAALVHGQDRAARRHQLEARLLGDFPRLGPDQRALGWTELAEVYAATGNPADAAICWINAVWDSPSPPAAWIEQWMLAECRCAKQSTPVPSLDRWLSEPGRFGAGRVVAAYAVWGAHRAAPPADLVSALPRVRAFLDQHFDDLPARAAWLAVLAVTQLCSGDALGLARWRDRILTRLRDKGPGLDLDEPSFLRFHGTASPDRFQTAREWLVRSHKPILEWIGKLGSSGKLQWAGLDAETNCTAAYAQLMLAWGLGCLGERTRSRDWAAKAKKLLSRPTGAGVDPAVHPLLADAFLERIRDVQEGRLARPGFPRELRDRIDALTDEHLGRYAVDKLRRHSRILEPLGTGRDYGGLDLRAFRGYDLLGERLQLLADRSDPALIAEEAKQILSQCSSAPMSTNVPRAALTLLDLAPHLEPTLAAAVLEFAEPAAAWMETWIDALSWSESLKAAKLPLYLMKLLHAALGTAAWFNLFPAVRPLVDSLVRRAGSDPVLRSAVLHATGPVFRSLRKLGYRSEAETLLQRLDPGRGAWPADSPTLPPSQFGLAVGWFAVGDEDAGNRILDDARNRLFVARTGHDRDRTELAIAYAEALGFAPPRIALGRLEEIFQLLERISTTGSTNRYFTLKPLQLIDAVVLSVITEEFALGPVVRGWLDDDEFLIRRRIHRDMAAVLNADGAV
jgi:hypothetical protein